MGSQPLTLPLAEQERLLREYAIQGSYRLSALLHRKRDEIVELAIERAVTLGVEQYGDAMFRQAFDDLERESVEELADGVNRQAVYSAREAGWQHGESVSV